MSTNDVPGARATNNDILAMGCWAEHDDGSLILVEAVEGGTVVYSIFDTAQDPPIEYRDSMPEPTFKTSFSYRPDDGDDEAIRWTWHDKTPFPWSRIMEDFEPGQKHISAAAQFTAAARVAKSLKLRAERIDVTRARSGKTILERLNDALVALRK